CEKLNELDADVLLLGGDFVSSRAEDIDKLAPLIADIRAPHGKFAVLGNHDVRASAGRVISTLERAGVRMLTNAHATLGAPFSDVTICGLDDPTLRDPRAAFAFDR